MSSNESTSNSPAPQGDPEGKPRNPALLVVLSLALLAGLVWAMAPGRAKFEPAPLRTLPAGCPHTVRDFVPTDATEVPGVDLRSFSPAQRNHVLFRLNMEPCPCGCNISIAGCRISHPGCPHCKALVDEIVAAEARAGSSASGSPGRP